VKRLTIALALVAVFAVSNDALATPMAPAGEVRGEYDPDTGNIQISVNSVTNWFVEHVGFASMTGDAPAGLPAGGGSVGDNDLRIGETNFLSSMTYDVDLGNVAITGIPDNGTLRVFWNASAGVPTQDFPVAFVPEPSTFAMAALGLFGVTATRRRRAV
jgi:hypothetical protein